MLICLSIHVAQHVRNHPTALHLLFSLLQMRRVICSQDWAWLFSWAALDLC